MKTDGTILFLYREDLMESSRNKRISQIDIYDFIVSTKPTLTHDCVMFVDTNGKTKIFKNRMGNDDRNDGITTEVFICKCNSTEHQIVFWLDKGEKEISVQIHLKHYNNIIKRIWVAVKYVFGYRSRYGDWDNFTLKPEDKNRLMNSLEKLN
jgi:hypothetical protein